MDEPALVLRHRREVKDFLMLARAGQQLIKRLLNTLCKGFQSFSQHLHSDKRKKNKTSQHPLATKVSRRSPFESVLRDRECRDRPCQKCPAPVGSARFVVLVHTGRHSEPEW